MLAKRYRLTKHGSFNYVYRKGTAVRAGLISLIFVKGGKGVKIGFSVPNKVGKAVVRNKVKRRMRAAAHLYTDKLRSVQLVFSAKAGASALGYGEIAAAVEKLLTKAELVKNA